MRALGIVLSCLVAFLVGACAPIDSFQAGLCERALLALVPAEAPVAILDRASFSTADGGAGLRLTYRLGSGEPSGALTCLFAGQGLDANRLDLRAVVDEGRGPLSPARLHMLKRFWLDRPEAGAERTARLADGALAVVAEIPIDLAYFLQQTLNALPVIALYGLLAASYTLIYALGRTILLVFGELAMIGAMACFAGVALFSGLGGLGTAGVVGGAVVFALLASAVHADALRRLVLQPAAGRTPLALLVASFALAIVVQEYVRLAQDAGDRLLPTLPGRTHVLARAGEFVVAVTDFQIALVSGAGVVLGALVWGMGRGRFGRCWRAMAEDPQMAALCGVSKTRLWAICFALAATLAGLAGVVVLLRFGLANAFMGAMLGFKALTAAVVGGIGRIQGAILGAVVIGGLETYWAAYFDMAWRDVAVFALLAATLVLRPQGLVGIAERPDRVVRP
ncbi:branched-chain amino acid ABC transporter permease [Rhodospirillum rubrum]|uniref:branched-chain amino acid ABC transporter permease n=2 Tax=Rhodospirillum rubrum TaxID=1085 RepID=UPI001F5B9570|nr:branched-chain amino acid ABC transporter permease [Rhodospirillum rubrum]